MRQLDASKSMLHRLFVEKTDVLQVNLKLFSGGRREYGDAILHAFAIANQYAAVVEIYVLYPKPQRFKQAKTAPVKQAADQTICAGQVRDHEPGFFLSQHGGEPLWSMRAYNIVDPRQIDIHDAFVEKEECRQRLGLCRWRYPAVVCEVTQKVPDLIPAHLSGVTGSVMPNEAPDPVDISFLGPIAVVPQPDRGPDCVQETRGCGHGIVEETLTS